MHLSKKEKILIKAAQHVRYIIGAIKSNNKKVDFKLEEFKGVS